MTPTLRVGLVGFGRIGRSLLRSIFPRTDLEIVALQDTAEAEALAYLLKFDTLLGRFPGEVRLDGSILQAGSDRIALLPAGKDAPQPAWRELGVEVVVIATGRPAERAAVEAHLAAGARRVVLCVPPVDAPDVTLVRGVNEGALRFEHRVISHASVTTHAVAPLLKLLVERFGVERAFLTAVHAYGSELKLADVPATDMRTGRAAAENISPHSTTSGDLVCALLPALAGRLATLGMSVPVTNGSLVDLVCWHQRPVSVEALNAAVREAAAGALAGVLDYEDAEIVSSDILRTTASGVFDSLSTMALGDRVTKTLTWFDNSSGYCQRLVEVLERLAEFGRATGGPA